MEGIEVDDLANEKTPDSDRWRLGRRVYHELVGITGLFEWIYLWFQRRERTVGFLSQLLDERKEVLCHIGHGRSAVLAFPE